MTVLALPVLVGANPPAIWHCARSPAVQVRRNLQRRSPVRQRRRSASDKIVRPRLGSCSSFPHAHILPTSPPSPTIQPTPDISGECRRVYRHTRSPLCPNTALPNPLDPLGAALTKLPRLPGGRSPSLGTRPSLAADGFVEAISPIIPSLCESDFANRLFSSRSYSPDRRGALPAVAVLAAQARSRQSQSSWRLPPTALTVLLS